MKHAGYQTNEKMKIFTINAPLRDIVLIDIWVQEGVCASRSEWIRNAIRNEFVRMSKLEEMIAEEMSDGIAYFTAPPTPLPLEIGAMREIDGMIMEYTTTGWKKFANLKH